MNGSGCSLKQTSVGEDRAKRMFVLEASVMEDRIYNDIVIVGFLQREMTSLFGNG